MQLVGPRLGRPATHEGPEVAVGHVLLTTIDTDFASKTPRGVFQSSNSLYELAVQPARTNDRVWELTTGADREFWTSLKRSSVTLNLIT